MDRALAVVDDTEQHRNLLREAGELAGGVDAELVLLATMSPDDYEEASEALAAIEEVEGTGYGETEILETAGEFAEEIGEDVLEGIDVDWRAIGAVVQEGGEDSVADTVIQTAESERCDHIFLPGRRRSPTGKAVFGDTAQSVILNFDKPVTVMTG